MTYYNAVKYIENAPEDNLDKKNPERLSMLFSALNSPQKNLKYIRIAGNSGKTVCASMLSSILTQAGYKVCVANLSATNDVREKISISGSPISIPDFVESVAQIYEYAQKLQQEQKDQDAESAPASIDQLTRGEILLTATLLYCRKQQCDLLIIESSGNNIDPSLMLKPPFAAIISGIIPEADINELSKIKLYIQRGIGEVVSTPQSTTAYKLLADICASANCRLSVPVRSALTLKRLSLIGTEFTYGDVDYKLSLCGRFQAINAITVIEAVKLLRRHGYYITKKNEIAGLSSVRLKSRFEVLSASPTVIADSTYKPEAIEFVCDSLFDFSEVTSMAISLCMPCNISLISKYMHELSKRGYKTTKLYIIGEDEDPQSIKVNLQDELELIHFKTPRQAAKQMVSDLKTVRLLFITGTSVFSESVRLEILRRLEF